MLLPRFQYEAPVTVAEACSQLKEYGDKAKVLAGGTDLLVNMKKKLLAPERIISLNRIEGLKEMEAVDGGDLAVGSLCTAAELADSSLIRERIMVLAEGAGRLGSPLIRNRATIGGNLVTARPASDLAPPLLVLDARLVLTGPEGERKLAVSDFFLGPGQTRIRGDEVLTRLIIPKAAHPGAGAYIKLGTRKAMEISIVNVASYLEMAGDGSLTQVRIALGAVAPVPFLAASASQKILGARPKGPEDPLFREAAREAAREAKPISDHRGSAEYRRAMVEVLTYRTLRAAYKRLRAVI
jgi:CO/xanthine dehydrogenase FAD-binding subunit